MSSNIKKNNNISDRTEKTPVNKIARPGATGILNEKIAGNKTEAHAVREDSNVVVKTDAASTMEHAEVRQEGAKSDGNFQVGESQAKQIHSEVITDESVKNSGSWQAHSEETPSLSHSTVKDALGRTMSGADAYAIANGKPITQSNDRKGYNEAPVDDDKMPEIFGTAQKKEDEHKAFTDPVPDDIGEDETEDNRGLYQNGKGQVKKSDVQMRWTTQNHGPKNNHKAAQTLKDTIKSQYSDSEEARGQAEAEKRMKQLAAITGIKHFSRSAVQTKAAAQMYHRMPTDEGIAQAKEGLKYIGLKEDFEKTNGRIRTKDDQAAFDDLIKEHKISVKGNEVSFENYAAEEFGDRYVVGDKNSYGSIVKDLRNNIRLLDKHFNTMGIDFTGWSQKDFEKAARTGIVKNKAGQNIFLNDKDVIFMTERAKCEKRKNVLRATGTWKDDVSDALGGIYDSSDTMQGYNAARNAFKAARAVHNAATAAAGRIAGGGVGLVNNTRRIVNSARAANARIHILSGKLTGKDAGKWKVKARTLKNKNLSIKASTARTRAKIRDVSRHPVKTAATAAGRGLGKGLGKLGGRLYAKTLGKTSFGQTLATVFKSRRGNQAGGIFKNIRRLHIRRMSTTGLKGFVLHPGKSLMNGLQAIQRAIQKMILGFFIALLVTILVCAPVVVICGFIGSVMPFSGNSSIEAAADDGQSTSAAGNMWDNAKTSMQNTIIESSDDVQNSFLPDELPALYSRGYNLNLTYDQEFVFEGFNFKGPINWLCNASGGREMDDDAASGSSGSSSSDDTSTHTTTPSTSDSKSAGEISDEIVSKKQTASFGPYAGSGSNVLSQSMGRNMHGPSGQETYYNMDMKNCVHTLDLHCRGKSGLSNTAHAWTRKDGVKMYGDENGVSYVMVAANLKLRPRGTIVKTSLGPGIVADTGGFASSNPTQLDIAVEWGHQVGGNASGNVDVWGAGAGGSDLTTNGAKDNGVTVTSYNYFRAILAMATAATQNEDDPAHQDFYSAYCSHIVQNSYLYAKYCQARKWMQTIGSNPYADDDSKNQDIYYDGPASQPDYLFGLVDDGENTGSPYPTLQSMLGNDIFKVSEIDRHYTYHMVGRVLYKRLDSITYAVSCNLVNCGLWGDYTVSGLDDDYMDEEEDSTMSPGRAGIASASSQAASVGMFDTEEEIFKSDLPSGNFVSTIPGTDAYMHSIGGGAGKSEAYEAKDPSDPDYEEWEGYKDDGEVGITNVKRGHFIYESGDYTSLVEASYEISDEDLQEEGINMGGLFNVDNTGQSGSEGGATADPLSDSEINTILQAVSEQCRGKAKQERLNAVEVALRLVGKATYSMDGGRNMHGVGYVSGRGKDNLTNFEEWHSSSDCSGYVSYILYKSGAKNFRQKSALNTDGLTGDRNAKSFSNLNDAKPGDIIVKTNGKVNGHYDSHVIMYIGSTSYGAFTVAECTTRSGQSGPQIRGYKSAEDFLNNRGRDYKHYRNYFGD